MEKNKGCKYCVSGHKWWYKDYCHHRDNFTITELWHGDEPIAKMSCSFRNANRDCPLFEEKIPPPPPAPPAPPDVHMISEGDTMTPRPWWKFIFKKTTKGVDTNTPTV